MMMLHNLSTTGAKEGSTYLLRILIYSCGGRPKGDNDDSYVHCEASTRTAHKRKISLVVCTPVSEL